MVFYQLLIGLAIALLIPKFDAAISENSFLRSPVILFLGAPFSGKGTQADMLASYLNIPVFQSGDLFRKEVDSGSDLGMKMLDFMNRGELIPDELTKTLITNTLLLPNYRSGVIMDGYPRNLDHLDIFENILKTLDYDIDIVIFMDASYELLLSRVENRLVCKNCSRSISVVSSTAPCCENPDLFKRSDDNIGAFEKRYNVYRDNTLPLVENLRLKYPEKFIHLTSEALSNLEKHQVHQLIVQEISNFPFRRIKPAIDHLSFEKPFNWLLRFIKSGKKIEKEDLKFYWALECNKPDQSGLLRRVVFVSTTSKQKYLEYRKTFLLYGIESIRFPVVNDENTNKMLLSEFDSPNFSAIALLSDTSNLYKPTKEPATIEELENGKIQLCSLKNGASCDNYCVLSVTYAVKNQDSTFILKSYKLVDHVEGTIKNADTKVAPFINVFGWDRIFYIKGLDKSYHELRENGYKKSARDRVLSVFLRRHVHYKNMRNLAFNNVPVKKSIDFSIDMNKFFSEIKEYNLELVQEYGFVNVWKQMVRSGTFFRAAAFRRIGIYWNPGVNSGLPLVKKADRIHEITFMAHDIGHQLLPDLVFTGKNSFSHKRVYIMWRMMSEAFTLALTDMVYIDALKNSGVEYDFDKRKIYPLFKSLNLDVSPSTNPDRLETIRKIVHANYVYCLRGDDSEYRALIGENGSMESLEAFKLKYAPFFVEDFRWTEQNYNSMVSTRSNEARNWWAAIKETNELLGEFKIRTIEDLLELDSDVNTDNLFERIFSMAFDKLIKPVVACEESIDLSLEDDSERKFRAFTRWMIGQLSICFKYDFIPESKELFLKITEHLKSLNKRISYEEINYLRGVYEAYLDRLLELSVISADDHATFSQVYPLFDPFFVNYDKSITEYERLETISKRILDDKNHHFSSYHRQAENVLGRIINQNEKENLNMAYLMLEKAGGKVFNGIFAVEPGVIILTEPSPVTADSALNIFITGISIETLLNFMENHQRKVSFTTSIKAKNLNLPLFEIKNYDQNMMKRIERALKSFSDLSINDSENINLTLPASKSIMASITVTLRDLHSILIDRLGGTGEVDNISLKLCQLLNEKYPDYIQSVEYYRSERSNVNLVSKMDDDSDIRNFDVSTRILPEAWSLFDSLNIPEPSLRDSSASSITIAYFKSCLTTLNFPKTEIDFSESINSIN